MAAPVENDRSPAVKALFRSLVAVSSDMLLSRPALMRRVQQLCPDRLASVIDLWEELDRAAIAYMEKRIPWEGTVEIERVIVIPGATMCEPGSDQWKPLRCRVADVDFQPDVMSLAREYLSLVGTIAAEASRA